MSILASTPCVCGWDLNPKVLEICDTFNDSTLELKSVYLPFSTAEHFGFGYIHFKATSIAKIFQELK